jgi:small subunit ribosomal protein S15
VYLTKKENSLQLNENKAFSTSLRGLVNAQEIDGNIVVCSILSLENRNMALTQQEKQELISEYQIHETDTGSADLQVAMLTKRINQLTSHLKENEKDHSSRRGLLKMIGRRRRLLAYINQKDPQRYQNLIARLGIRR